MTKDDRAFKHHVQWLMLWFGLGLLLRLVGLTLKPLWTDEFATIVFSLGNSFRTVPLDQVLSLAELLQPLQPNPQTSWGDVVHYLRTESNHPPLYFLLTHLWLKLFSAPDGYVSVWGVRSLSVFLGALSIPATFALSWLAFRSVAIARTATVFTALSPFGVYLAQEARHYTLPILWIVGSLACLVRVVQLIGQRRPFPLWLCGTWIVVNALGIATHYFFVLTLVAEGLVLGAVLIWGSGLGKTGNRGNPGPVWETGEIEEATLGEVESEGERPLPLQQQKIWRRLSLVVLGTGIAVLVWLPWMTERQDSELTRWIYRSNRMGWDWLTPLGQLMGGWITMVYLLPIQSIMRWVAIASIITLLLLTLLTLPLLWRGLRIQLDQPSIDQLQRKPAIALFSGFVGSAIALFLGITYFLGIDLTVAFRYNFVYFPAVMVLWGVAIGGIKEPRSQGVKESGSQGAKEPRSQGAKEPRSQGVKESRSQGIREPRSQGIREPRSQESGVRKSRVRKSRVRKSRVRKSEGQKS